MISYLLDLNAVASLVYGPSRITPAWSVFHIHPMLFSCRTLFRRFEVNYSYHMIYIVSVCDIIAYSSLTKRPYLCLSHHFLYILYIV